jgi:FkbH-like protein
MHDVGAISWFGLTSRQRSIWLDLQGSGNLGTFQVGAYLPVVRKLNLDLLRDALSDVMARHDALRLRIDPDEPRQRIDHSLDPPIELIDISSEADPEDAVVRLVDRLFQQPFPLDRGFLFQIIVARIDSERCYWVLRFHHIITDAIAFSIMLKDVAATYDALSTGASDERPRSSYLNFHADDAAYCSSPRFQRDLEYWMHRLADLPKGLFNPRRGEPKDDSSLPLVRAQIDFPRYQRFLDQCTQTQIRPGNALLALAAGLLTSATERTDIVLAVAYPGRTKENRSTIGVFSGVLPLRIDVPPDISFRDLAVRITELLRRDYLHHLAPIDDICRNLGLAQRRRRNVFDVMVSYVPLDVVDFEIAFGQKVLRLVPVRGPEANPLAIYVSELNRGRPVTMEFAFNREYLRREDVVALLERFERLFDAFSNNPATRISDITRFTDVDRRRLFPESKELTGGQNKNRPGVSDRKVEKAAGAESLQIRVLAGFTADPLAAPLQFWMQRLGLDSRITFASYNQIFQELLNSASATRRNRNGANVVMLRLEDWLRDKSGTNAPNIDGSGEDHYLEKVAADFVTALAQAAETSHVPYIVMICPPSAQWGIGGNRADTQAALLAMIRTGVEGLGSVQLVTYADYRALYPVDVEHDSAGDQLGHLPYTTSAFTAMATLLARRIHLMLRAPIKVVVVDCDNTLWDGVVAEDGIKGIRLTESHLKLQHRLVDVAKNGVLVCLCSKNVEADVLAVFEQRSDMVLKLDHIVAHRINWKAKSQNIRGLAAELSLGLDSFVVLDDNPLEIGEVAAHCPQVIGIPCVPAADERRIHFDHLWPLDVRPAIAEDSNRLKRYRQNALRSKAREASLDYQSFIAGLDLRIRIESPKDIDLARLAQLTERTNQFNINGRLRSGAELRAQNRAKSSTVRAVFVEDKFGDYGLVGLLTAHCDQSDLIVDSLLMSCRVLGRGVEHRMIAELGRLAGEFGAANVRIPVRTTARNLPVRQFLESLDAQLLPEGEDHLYVFTQSAAAACAFRPESAEPVEAVEELSTAPWAVERASHVASSAWVEIATTLCSVSAIEQAVRGATTVENASATAYCAPRGETERTLAEIFCATMGLDRVGIDDDFFDIGVHSLLAVQLVSSIRDRFDIQLPIRTLFECSTIAKLAKAIGSETSRSGYQPLVPLQIGDDAPPLFCCHPGNGDAVCYMRLTNALGPDQTVYGFEASGLAPGETMARSVEEMAGAYVKEMVAVRPKGPYYLIGWSFGGALAFEMARQIQAAGGEIGLLAFMDAIAPDAQASKIDAPERKDGIDEDRILEGVTHHLDILRRYLKLPPRPDPRQKLKWEEIIENFQLMGIVPPAYTVPEMRRKMFVYGNCTLLFSRYRPARIAVPIVHYQAAQNFDEWNFDWRPHTTMRVRSVRIKCNHFRMGFEPNINVIANDLRARIRGGARGLGWWRRSLAIFLEPSRPIPRPEMTP